MLGVSFRSPPSSPLAVAGVLATVAFAATSLADDGFAIGFELSTAFAVVVAEARLLLGVSLLAGGMDRVCESRLEVDPDVASSAVEDGTALAFAVLALCAAVFNSEVFSRVIFPETLADDDCGSRAAAARADGRNSP